MLVADRAVDVDSFRNSREAKLASHGEGVSRSYEGNDRTSVPNFVSEDVAALSRFTWMICPFASVHLIHVLTVASLRQARPAYSYKLRD